MKLVELEEEMSNHFTTPEKVITEVMSECYGKGLPQKGAEQAAYEELVMAWDADFDVAADLVDEWSKENYYEDCGREKGNDMKDQEYEESRAFYSAMMQRSLINGMDEIAKINKDACLMNKYDGFVNPYIKESLLNQIDQLRYQIENLATE